MTDQLNTAGAARPAVIELNLDGIPQDLRELPRWLGWRYEWQPHPRTGFLGDGKWVKTPKQVHGGRVGPWNAKSNTPDTWCSFEEAVAAYQARGSGEVSHLDGIGLALGDGLHGVDLDDCYHWLEGFNPLAAGVLERIDGYAEVSPSGTGVKIFTRTDLQRAHVKTELELYPDGRWFAVTGARVNGHAALPAEMQSVGWLVEREFGADNRPVRAAVPAVAGPLSTQINLLRSHKAADPEWPLERVRDELLPRLNPDVPNNEWVRVGEMLHHQGGGEPEWLELWDEWSQGSEARPLLAHAYTPGECEKRWATFGRRELAGADPRSVVTIRAFLYETKDARARARARASAETVAAEVASIKAAPVPTGAGSGDETPGVPAPALAALGETLKRWRAEVESAAALADRDAADAELARLGAIYGAQPGLKALIGARDMDAEGLVQTYAKALKKAKGLSRIPSAEARSILTGGPAVLATTQSGAGRAAPRDPLFSASLYWVFNAGDDTYRNLSTGASRSGLGFDTQFKRYMPANQDGSYPSAAEWVRTHGNIRVVDQMAYHPMGDETFTHKDKLLGNRYRAASVPAMRRPETEEEHAALALVKEQFEFLLPDPRDRGLLLSWIAWNARHPGDKVLWMPFVQGVPGAGKSSITGLLAACMGEENVGKVSNEALHTEYTGWKTDVAVRVLDEVKQRQGGQAAAWSLVEKLREPIVDSTVTVHRKNENEFETPNVTNYIAFSNYRDALPITNAQEERRLCMLFSPVTAAAVKERKAAGVFGRFHDALHTHASVLRWWLASCEWVLGAFEMHPEFEAKGHAPMTAAKEEVAVESQSDAAELVAEALLEPGLGISASVVSTTCLRLRLVELARAYALHVPSPKATAGILSEKGWISHPTSVRFNGKPHRAWTRETATGLTIVGLLEATATGTAVLKST